MGGEKREVQRERSDGTASKIRREGVVIGGERRNTAGGSEQLKRWGDLVKEGKEAIKCAACRSA